MVGGGDMVGGGVGGCGVTHPGVGGVGTTPHPPMEWNGGGPQWWWVGLLRHSLPIW